MKIIGWLIGYVTLVVKGRELPRFLRLCSAKDIFVWDISFAEWNQLRLRMYAKDVFAIRDILKKTNAQFNIEQKRGVPFLLRRYKRKTVFAVGIAATLVLLFFLSGFVWKIQIRGNSYISDEMILKYLEDKQYGVGVRKSKINAEKLEDMFSEDFPEIIWNSVSIHGTTLHISIKEQIQNDVKSITKKKNLDLISPKDGTVEKIFIRNGTAAVEKGQKVKKGDVLVYGYVPIMDESNTAVVKVNGCVADADVLILGKEKIKNNLARNYPKREYTGRERKYLYFGSKQGEFNIVPYLYGKQRHTSLRSIRQASFMRTIALPVYVTSVYEKEYYVKNANYTAAELKQKQELYCNGVITNLEQKGIQIIEKNVMISYGKKECILTGELVCLYPARDFRATELPGIEKTGNDAL